MRKQFGKSILIYLFVFILFLSSLHGIGSWLPARAEIGETPAESEAVSLNLDETQLNSIAMLNYLAVLTQEINASRNSRLLLEQAYSSLINNIYPNAIDYNTLEHLNGILDTLETYRMASVKRERLKYVYEQNRASAFRSALPNPLNVLNIVQSKSMPAIALSIFNLAVDVYASYTSHTEEIEFEYLQEGWGLDDEEADELHNTRKEAFNYLVMIVGEYDLPGDLALNEKSVEEFVARKGGSNIIQRIQFMESNRATYQAMGEYWLVLAESYYLQGEYVKCLEAINQYEAINPRIFRKDYAHARILPLAIVAAKEALNQDEYVAYAKQNSEKILLNTDNDEWALRYFVAQTYIDLFAKTSDSYYLNQAFEIVLNNVNYLVSKQQSMNAEYLADVVTTSVPKGATKSERAQIDSYNRQLKEERTSALAPVYEPLLLNCEMLFFLADERGVSESEKMKIDGILHENGLQLFLNPSLDKQYRFSQLPDTAAALEGKVVYRGKELQVPAAWVTGNASITVAVKEPGTEALVIFDDWTVARVDREKKGDFGSFIAVFSSAAAQKHKFVEGAEINIDIIPREGADLGVLNYKFHSEKAKQEWWEVVKVWEDGIAYVEVEE